MSYTSYDNDRLEAAEKLKIERTIYFESEKADISALAVLPLSELIRQREESAAAEQAIFESLQAQAAAWEQQAGKTLFLEKAMEYARTPAVSHTNNQWQKPDEYRNEMSNAVYRMNYYIYENTRYDREKQQSVPYSYTLTWGVYTNGPDRNRQMKIAGQDRKVFPDRAAMDKYLAGRQKAYANLFTEVSPPIPQQYASCFKVNGVLLPGYTVEGETRKIPEQVKAAAEPVIEVPKQTAPVPQKTEAILSDAPQPVIPIILNSEKPGDKLKEITARLEHGITELFNSNRFQEYLRVMAKFHNYSFNNTLLIAMQKPDASQVAGFSAWKNNFGRNVMKGQKGIKILAPAPYIKKQEMEVIDPQTQKPLIGKDGKPVTEEKEITVPAFKVVSVFDVSQTEGKELPEIEVNELTGKVELYEIFFKALKETSPVPIAFEQIPGGAHGYYHLQEKRIAIDEGMSELQTLKTAIHEIAHAKLHSIDLNAPKDEQTPRADRRTREVEAESVAYTVCQHYGLDTSDYSFGYVAGWSSGRELAELKGSLETIRTAAAEIINSIDAHITELQKAQEKEQAQPEIPTPDVSIGVKEMQDYGYSWDGMLPLREEVAKRLFAQDIEIFRIYSDGTEGLVTDLANLREHAGQGGLFGVEKKTWEALHEYNTVKQQLQEGEPTKEALLLYGKEDSYGIYQLARSEETQDLRFEPYDRLIATGHAVDRANYELIYSAPLTAETTLNSIYEKFNIDHPKDFKGHSLSVSDIVVLHQNGENTAHYVDSIGFQRVPEFLQEKQPLIPDEHLTGEHIKTPRGSFSLTDMTVEQMKEAGYGLHHTSDDGKFLIMGNGTYAYAVAAEQQKNHLKAIEDTVEQNDNHFDGIINNTPQTPTADELEQKAKAGEPISLVDPANAAKADKGSRKEEKPSIRAQLKADKARTEQRKKAKQKQHDLEV